MAFFGEDGTIVWVWISGSGGNIGGNHTDNDRFVVHFGSFFDNSMFVQMTVIASWFGAYQVLDVGGLDKRGDEMGGFGLIIFFMRAIGTMIGCFENTTLECTFVDQGGIFDVVSGMTHDGDNGVGSVGIVFPIDVF